MVSLGILFYVTHWDYFMHNLLAPINGGIEGGYSSGSAAPTSWVGGKFEFAASAWAAWLNFICLANQTGVLTTRGHECRGYRTVITVFMFLADSWLQIQADKHRLRGVRTRQLSSFCSVHSLTVGCRYVRNHFQHLHLCAGRILGLNPGMLGYTSRQHIILSNKFMRINRKLLHILRSKTTIFCPFFVDNISHLFFLFQPDSKSASNSDFFVTQISSL